MHLLITDCVKKKRLKASELEIDVDGDGPIEKEHFVQLNVIIASHYKHYGDGKFSDGVRKLMILRDHYNLPDNLYEVPRSINMEKRNITDYYIKRFNRNEIASRLDISNELAVYIQSAYRFVAAHIELQGSETVSNVREDFMEYVNWLESLCQ